MSPDPSRLSPGAPKGVTAFHKGWFGFAELQGDFQTGAAPDAQVVESIGKGMNLVT